MKSKPFTKRGILAVNGSIYDPLGMCCPVSLGGRLLQRLFMPPKNSQGDCWSDFDWDDPLPNKYHETWLKWFSDLSKLSVIELERCYRPTGFGPAKAQILHVFCDASKDAISYVIYLQIFGMIEGITVSFVHANSKVAPRMATSIPRLELCAAVEAVVATQRVIHEMDTKLFGVNFYTDFQVLLGYLKNEEKHFSRYVTRRIELILRHSEVVQWNFISSTKNPADIGTRAHTASELDKTCWLSGPPFLREVSSESKFCTADDPEKLPETMETKLSCLHTTTTTTSESSLCYDISSRTNDWQKALAIMKQAMKLLYWLDNARQRRGLSLAPRTPRPTKQQAIVELILNTQGSVYENQIADLRLHAKLIKPRSLINLDPFLDSSGILRVGGRISRASIPFHLSHPIILPKNHPVSLMLLHYYHHKVMHAGRHITGAALRNEGYFLVGAHKSIRSIINDCFVCRALRAPLQTQLMSELPSDRLEQVPPFTNTGMDVFGPYHIHDGKKYS